VPMPNSALPSCITPACDYDQIMPAITQASLVGRNASFQAINITGSGESLRACMMARRLLSAGNYEIANSTILARIASGQVAEVWWSWDTWRGEDDAAAALKERRERAYAVARTRTVDNIQRVFGFIISFALTASVIRLLLPNGGLSGTLTLPS